MGQFRVAIMGTGNIANAMATAVTGLGGDYILYAVASRSLQKAQEFAEKWKIEKAYGSYEEMVADSGIDMIYVASPHSAHYENTKLCLENGRNVLVEKAFTANAKQAKELILLAEEKGLFLGEAIWTRFQPAVQIIRDILESGELGNISSMEADFSVPISHIQRMYDPALCGGALLDLGMYALTTADLYFGNDIVEKSSTCDLYETGVDATDEIRYTYANGRKALLKTSFVNPISNYALIEGEKAKLTWLDLNNPRDIKVLDLQGEVLREIPVPKQINGYEYEVIAARKAIEAGKTECPEMPHGKTLEIMEVMDGLRKDWGVVYPYDEV